MQQGERKMKDYRQSPSFWPYALLSQRITLSPRCVSPFSRRVIFTCSCISLTLLSLRENGDYSKSYYMQVEIASLEREKTGLSKLWQRFLTLLNTRDREEKLVNSWPVRLPSNNPRNNKTLWLKFPSENKKTKMHFIWVSMYLAQKYYMGTLFLHLLLEMGPPFYVVI